MVVGYVLQAFFETVVETYQYLSGSIRIGRGQSFTKKLRLVDVIVLWVLVAELKGSFDC